MGFPVLSFDELETRDERRAPFFASPGNRRIDGKPMRTSIIEVIRSDAVEEFVEKQLKNTVISKVLLEYPVEYLRQDRGEYVQRPISAD
ncbi:MAG: hypothetical protein JZU55_21975 [Afipia sp.]|nr:hypothetical protein [Afipia sp.]